MDRVKAHWIFSGDEDDYDGYYINCSSCGVQRKAYDRDCELDIPVACPHCGIAINREAWEVNDIANTVVNPGESSEPEKLFKVCVIHEEGKKKRPYILTVRTTTEKAAKQIALYHVAKKWLHRNKVGNDLHIDYVEEVR